VSIIRIHIYELGRIAILPSENQGNECEVK